MKNICGNVYIGVILYKIMIKRIVFQIEKK